jgi:hypothetical protein
MEEIWLQYHAKSRQTLVSRQFSFPQYPEGVLLTAENASKLQAAAQEWVYGLFRKFPEQDELLPCPLELANRAIFLQQREAELVSVDLERCDDPYLRVLANNARRLGGNPNIAQLEGQQILLINQFEAILIIGLRCYPVFAISVDNPVDPDCDLSASVWMYPPNKFPVPYTQFWQCYRNKVPYEHHETAIISFPLIQLEKARQVILTRSQRHGVPDLHLALIAALQHICPTPLRGCQCLFQAVCPGCHYNKMHRLEDLLKYELAGGLCYACQRNTYAGQREKSWER